MRTPTLLALGLLAACDAATETCPGDEVAFFEFVGRWKAAGDPSLAGLDPVPSLPDCEATVGYPPKLKGYSGSLSAGPSAQAAALCRPGDGVLFGTRTGDRFVVETVTEGAVLAGCGGSCSARLRLVVAGDVLPGGSAPVTGFSGALVEVLSPSDGGCAACTLPCAGRYLLTGTVP